MGFVAQIEHPPEGVPGDLHACCRAACLYLSIQILYWYRTVIECRLIHEAIASADALTVQRSPQEPASDAASSLSQCASEGRHASEGSESADFEH